MTDVTGFIVDGFPQNIAGRPSVALLGRLSDGRTFAVIDDRHAPRLFVRASDRDLAARILRDSLEETDRTTIDGEPVLVWKASSSIRLREADRMLREGGVRTYEADFSAVEALCLDAGVLGTVRIQGEARPGTAVDLVFHNPDLSAADWDPELTVLSLDIETDVESGRIIAVSLVSRGPWADPASEVILAGDGELTGRPAATGAGKPTRALEDQPWIHPTPDEASLLGVMLERIREIDPDIITGWNVIDFDMATIAERVAFHRMPFAISRSTEPARFLPAVRNEEGRRQNAGVSCRGRLVVDGLRLLRYGPQNFSDRRLESVAQAVLGEGKTITAEHSRDKVESIMRLYREDPVALCEYCRRDAELVLEILDKTGLLVLTIARSRLTGVSLNRAWTSIPAFEFLYTEAMHRRGLVAPTAGVDLLPQGEAPGGAIITPDPGLYDNVLVFDFKSLYPSLMRTFNIDPVAYAGQGEGYGAGGSTGGRQPGPSGKMGPGDKMGPGAPEAGPTAARPEAGPIVAPNGARFSRDPGILPELLDRFWANRELAKKQGDNVASHVYKIIMNSFYGVLGAPQCRFAGAALAGAITSFGQHLLHWTQDRFEEQGYRVLYGDTDSLFVLAAHDGTAGRVGKSDQSVAGGSTPDAAPGQGGPAAGRTITPPGDTDTEPTGSAADAVSNAPDPSPAALWPLGRDLAEIMNHALTEFIETTWQVESRLELEFEKVYRRFYLPYMRGSSDDGEARGRAKSYAGLLLGAGGEDGGLEIKGMEAVRSDWTPAAAAFQTRLLQLILGGEPLSEVEDYIRQRLEQLRSGALDDLLIYSRRLRKPVSAYTKSRPPHVRAALMLPPEQREGRVEYLMTTEGPQPPSIRSAPVDLDHYAQKQLRPIAETLCEPLGVNVARLFDLSQQLSLF